MPELPEVEVLVRNLEPLLKNREIGEVQVRRPKVLRPTTAPQLVKALTGGRFLKISRRGKYLLFSIQSSVKPEPLLLVGHLGMTGRMYLQTSGQALHKHAAVILRLGEEDFVFEDTRYFGRFTLDTSALEKLGPEPLGPEFNLQYFTQALQRSSQPIKVKLLDQGLVAGIGNIYASEALFNAKISPRAAANRLKSEQVERLWRSIREVLTYAIEWGSTVRLDLPGTFGRNGLFYFGSQSEPGDFYTERLRVYDHEGDPCPQCGTPIQRLTQAARSTYYCPFCQRK